MTPLDKVDYAYFCGRCGSPSLDISELVGTAKCNACDWAGSTGDLAAMPIEHEFGSSEKVIQALMGDMRVLLAKHLASPLLHFLMKWGFLGNKNTANMRHEVGRYLAAMSRAMLTAVIEERQKMEKEKHNGIG